MPFVSLQIVGWIALAAFLAAAAITEYLIRSRRSNGVERLEVLERRMRTAMTELDYVKLDTAAALDAVKSLQAAANEVKESISRLEQGSSSKKEVLANEPPTAASQPDRAPVAARDASYPGGEWRADPPAMSDYARARSRGRPVDFNGSELLLSDALEAVGLLVVDGTTSGGPELYINESVALNNMAFDRWTQLFEFRGGEAFQRFKTIKPSRVRWDPSTQRGALEARGVAEALP